MERRDSWKICSRTLPPFSADRRVPSLAFRGLEFCGGNTGVLRYTGLYGAAELRRIRTLSRRRGRAGSGVADSVCAAPDFRGVSPRCFRPNAKESTPESRARRATDRRRNIGRTRLRSCHAGSHRRSQASSCKLDRQTRDYSRHCPTD